MYGYGTHSWYRSTEFRQMKREREEATREYQRQMAAGERETVYAPMACTCSEFDYPHIHRRQLEK